MTVHKDKNLIAGKLQSETVQLVHKHTRSLLAVHSWDDNPKRYQYYNNDNDQNRDENTAYTQRELP